MSKEMSENNNTVSKESAVKSVEAQEALQVFKGQKKVGVSRGGSLLNNTYTSLYIDDTGLKLLSVKGDRVIKWADSPLDPGLVKDGVITAPEVVAQKVKNLLREHKVDPRKVIAGFSGLHCLSRVITLPRLSGVVLAEAIKREIEGDLPVSLDNLYLAWQIVSSSKTELKIFIITYARDIADSAIQTLRQAGIKPYLMDLAPLAISQTVAQKTAAIVDTRETGVDIVILADGVPELIRSLPLPREKSLPEKIAITRDELVRTIKFHYSNKPEGSPQSSLPVYVSGFLLDQPELYQSFSQGLEYAVAPAQVPLKYPAEMANNHYLVNIGLILKKTSLGGSSGVSEVNLNAFPQTHAGRRVWDSPVFLGLGAVIVAGLIVLGINYLQNYSARTEAMRTELSQANRIYSQDLTLQKTLTDSTIALQSQVAASQKSLDNLTAVQASFGSQHSAINGDLTLTSGSLLWKMNLVSLTHSGDSLTLIGTAASESDVQEYAKIMENSGRYSVVQISNIDKKEYANIVKVSDEYKFETDTVYNFTLILKVKE
jgi:hypothetical protein